jgi:signal transduction histidine kinase
MIMPIFLHLHWKFPYPLAKLPRRFIEVFYGLVFLISLLTIFRVLPSQTSILLSVIAVFGSTIILIVKIVVQKDHKVDNKFILFAFLLIFIPPLVTTIAYTYADVTLDYFGFTGAYMAMPALPSAYFIVAFQNTVYGKRTRIIIRRLYVFLVLVCSLSISGLLFYIGDQNILLGMSSIIFFMAAVAILSLSIVVIPMMGVMAYNERMDSRQRYLSTGLEPRSNRLITPYLFLVIAGGVFGAAVVFVAIKFDLPSRDYEIVAITGLTTIGLTLGLYPVFRSWMDQRVYGIRYSPDGLRDSFSRRIVSMLSIQDLTHLIEDEILPSMMIRKSALYYLREQGAFELLSSYGVENDEPVDIKKLIPHIPGTKTSLIYRSAIADYCPEWVQIVFRLSIKGKLIGVWLLGRKDPDDEYLFSDLVTLQTLSSQISVALSNILTTIQLHNHYQANIDRDEADRVEIARGLHDEVLNRLASLAMLINQDADKKQLLASYEETKLNLRLIIRRLRPAVLDFGLGHAIHDMASELMDANENLRINVNLPYQSPSFDESVETHIFRIVQHACENAALHSQAHEVHVSGVLKPDRININVKDEGVGFKYDEMDNATLIEDGHFGLVGIQERTDLIHATLIVNTDEGRGTEIQVHWEEVNYD